MAVNKDDMMQAIFDGFMEAEKVFHIAKASGDDLVMVSKMEHDYHKGIDSDIKYQIKKQSYLSRLDELILHYV